jgi:nitrogen regulatory protein PII
MMTTKVWPGRGIDDGVDFHYDPDEYDMDWLRRRRDLVWAFDAAVDQGIANFIEFCKTHKIVDEQIQVTKTIKVAEEC